MATRTADTTSTATPGRFRWTTVELVSVAIIGVAFGVVYWGWAAAYAALSTPLTSVAGPLVGLLGGPWLLAGVVGGLIVRRPGAALFAEIVAASVEAIIGNEWGWTTLISGTLQGLGVEVVLAIFLYKKFGPGVAMLGAALAAFFEFGYELNAYWADTTTEFKIVYVVLFMISGAIVAGLGGWLLTQALARTGAIDALPAGRAHAEAQRARAEQAAVRAQP